MNRSRILYFVLTISVIALGLGSRSGIIDRTTFIGEYSGDTLWAMMVYFGFAMVFAGLGIRQVIVIALCFAFAIEFSQLIQQDWIKALRANRLGGLVLGHGFLWSDLVCYCVGIACGAGVDWGIQSRLQKGRTASSEDEKVD